MVVDSARFQLRVRAGVLAPVVGEGHHDMRSISSVNDLTRATCESRQHTGHKKPRIHEGSIERALVHKTSAALRESFVLAGAYLTRLMTGGFCWLPRVDPNELIPMG
jgi:hypothetical protein